MSTAKTTADSLLYSLNLKILKELMARNPEFEFKIYINAVGMSFNYFIRVFKKNV